MWSGERTRVSRGQVVCQVPSSATHVSYISCSPDDNLIAVSADKLVYIVDVKVCKTQTEICLLVPLVSQWRRLAVERYTCDH